MGGPTTKITINVIVYLTDVIYIFDNFSHNDFKDSNGGKSMSRKDYRNEIDQHRQSLSTENEEVTKRPSRSQRIKKKRGNNLIRILFFIFILIPLCLLIYVWKFYEPGQKKVNVDKEVPAVTYEQNDKENENNSSLDDESDKEDSEVNENTVDTPSLTKDDEKENSNTSNSGSTSTNGNTSTNGSASTNGDSSTSTNTQGSSSSNQGTTDNASGQKIHIVKEKENLYKIAAQYYNNPGNGIELIKQANGLTSDVVWPNQQLIIPQ